MVYVRECLAYDLIWKFYGILSCVQVFKPCCLFLCMMKGCLLTSLIYRWLPNFPNITCWRDIFLLYVLASFAENYLTVVEWAYFWALSFVHWSICLFSCQYHAVLWILIIQMYAMRYKINLMNDRVCQICVISVLLVFSDTSKIHCKVQ